MSERKWCLPQRAPLKLLDYIISTTYPLKDDKIKPARQSSTPPFEFHHVFRRRHDMLRECCFAIFPELVAVNHSIWKGRLQFFSSCSHVGRCQSSHMARIKRNGDRARERMRVKEREREKLEKANHTRGTADISESSSYAQSKWLPCALSSLVCILKK